MGFIIIIPFTALAAWAIVAMYRWLRRAKYGPKWWNAFKLSICVGLGLGVWFAFFLQYTVANTHLEGFPIPVQISNREKPTDPWVKAPLPSAIHYAAMFTNLLSGVALCLIPIAVGSFFKENRARQDPHGNPIP
jgi:hypothetical protein